MPTTGESDGNLELGRRSVLSAVGAAAVGGFATAASAQPDGAGDEVGAFAVAQSGQCTPVVPLAGDVPVEELYDYRVPPKYGGDNGATGTDGPHYQSNGTTDLQAEDTTISFLYLGPNGLSLVVVHDTADNRQEGSGGAVTWTVEGVQADAEWAVMDDRYVRPDTGEKADSNSDRWAVDGDTHTVDWTWGSAGTDGGALRTTDETLAITIRPSFNEAAALWGERYAEDPIDAWQFLSFPAGREDPQRRRLALDEPVTVRPGACQDGSNGSGGSDDTPDRTEERDVVAVDLDIEIGALSLQHRGTIPVGLNFPEWFDPNDVDIRSLRLGPPEVVADGGGARPTNAEYDDGPVVYFPTSETGFSFGDTSARLVGRTKDDRRIVGTSGLHSSDDDSSLWDDLGLGGLLSGWL